MKRDVTKYVNPALQLTNRALLGRHMKLKLSPKQTNLKRNQDGFIIYVVLCLGGGEDHRGRLSLVRCLSMCGLDFRAESTPKSHRGAR